jgi:hypothetical protein
MGPPGCEFALSANRRPTSIIPEFRRPPLRLAGSRDSGGWLPGDAAIAAETFRGSVLVASGFPVFGIVYSYALCSFVAAERDGSANRLGFVFAVTAFATLLLMLLVQLAVTSGLGEFTRDLDAQTARALRRGLRLVDFGLDVAWDLLMGMSLIFTGWAIRRRNGLGPGWGIPCAAFGAAAILLNAATFPWPPGSHGLFDIGPMIGIFMLALSARLAMLGRGASRQTLKSIRADMVAARSD